MGFEANILIWIQENIRSSWLTPIMKGVSALTNMGILWIVIGIILLIVKKTRKKGVMMLLGLVMHVIFCNVLLKNIVARPRPYDVIKGLEPLVEKLHDYSFPSGHTCASFIGGMIIYKQFPKYIGIPVLILSIVTAFSRMYLGVHYLTDIIGGVALGMVIALLSIKIVECCIEKFSKKLDN